MPLVRINLAQTTSPEVVKAISDVVYEAMIDVVNVPKNDKFQIITRHAPDELIYPEEGYLGLNYTRDLIIIQVTWVSGRSTEVKKKFFRQIADEIHAKGGCEKKTCGSISLIRAARIGLSAMVRCSTGPSDRDGAAGRPSSKRVTGKGQLNEIRNL